MPEHPLINQLRAARVVPVVRMKSAAHAATAVRWLYDAGLRIFEITMTIPDAPGLIRELSSDPALLVGAGTVPDVETAEICLRAGHRAGAQVVKVFPASSAGGPSHIRALRSVFPDVVFCPTGGVDPGNLGAYLAAGAAFVGMGGKLVDESLVAAGEQAAVMDVARQILGT
jgi:2-dehydro-3-deoxyphosphogluconate aldolase/(4S)-4-hydroxy-2-oxoglutarate aldolase